MPSTIEETTEGLTDVVAESRNDEEKGATILRQEDIDLNQGTSAAPSDEAVHKLLKLPSSALSNVLNEAKQKRLVSQDITDSREDTLNLGDATIQSFEDLINDAADITADMTNLIKTGAEDEYLQQKHFDAQNGDDTTTNEVAFISHLTSRMERLMTNLHEARRGISRLEQKVAHAPESENDLTVSQPQSSDICTTCNDGSLRQTHSHTRNVISTSGWIPTMYTTFTLPIPLLFWPRGKNNLLPRPTWLGCFVLSIWTWYVLECAMCELYCRPVVAEYYVWPKRREPEFPFVLPTMVSRSIGLEWLAGIGKLLVAIWRMFSISLGWSDGFVEDNMGPGMGGSVVGKVTKSVVDVVTSVLPNVAQDYAMMNDEFL
jgi:hypothetical protein